MVEAAKVVDELESKAPTLSWGLRLAAAAGIFDRTAFEDLARRLGSGSGRKIEESLFQLVISCPLVERAHGENWSVNPWFRDVLSERLKLAGNGDSAEVHAVLAERLAERGGQQWGEGLDGRQLHVRWLFHSMQADRQRTSAPIADFMEAYGRRWIGEARAVLSLTERTRPDIANRDIEFTAAVGLEAYREGERERALRAFESVWMAKERPSTYPVAIALHLLGKMKRDLRALDESIEMGTEIGSRFHVAQVLHTRGQVLGRRGQRKEALEDLGRSIEVGTEIGKRFHVAQVLHTRGQLLGRRGQRKDALDDLGRSVELERELGRRFGEAQVLHARGQLLGRWGQRKEALEDLGRSIEAGTEIGNRFHVAEVLHTRGQLLGSWGQRKDALDDLGRSVDLLRQLRDGFGEAQVLHTRGKLLGEWSEVEAALEDLNESIRLGQRFGQFRTRQVVALRDKILIESGRWQEDEDKEPSDQ